MLNKSKKILLTCLLATTVLTAAACGNADQPTPPIKEPAASTVDFAALPFEDKLMHLAGYIGQTDAQVVAEQGAGTVNKSEDGKLLISREYTVPDGDISHSTSIMYSENQQVELVHMLLATGTFGEWQERLSAKLGKPAQVHGGAAEGGEAEGGDGGNSKSVIWHVDQKEYVLQSAFGETSIMITQQIS